MHETGVLFLSICLSLSFAPVIVLLLLRNFSLISLSSLFQPTLSTFLARQHTGRPKGKKGGFICNRDIQKFWKFHPTNKSIYVSVTQQWRAHSEKPLFPSKFSFLRTRNILWEIEMYLKCVTQWKLLNQHSQYFLLIFWISKDLKKLNYCKNAQRCT